MFESLYSVPWASLVHAYGWASDVPRMLLDLAYGGRRAQDEAFWYGLHAAVAHQGNIYPATAYVIPFVLELLVARPGIEWRLELLKWLAAR